MACTGAPYIIGASVMLVEITFETYKRGLIPVHAVID